MPRFVLLYHECPPDYQRPSHWDFMLEDGDVLRTWALAQLPRDWQPLVEQSVSRADSHEFVAATNTVPAEQLPDHRPMYLDYEGPVSGERGNVTRVESGTYNTGKNSADCLELAIAGRSLQGRITLTRHSSESTDWRLLYRPDSAES